MKVAQLKQAALDMAARNKEAAAIIRLLLDRIDELESFLDAYEEKEGE